MCSRALGASVADPFVRHFLGVLMLFVWLVVAGGAYLLSWVIYLMHGAPVPGEPDTEEYKRNRRTILGVCMIVVGVMFVRAPEFAVAVGIGATLGFLKGEAQRRNPQQFSSPRSRPTVPVGGSPPPGTVRSHANVSQAYAGGERSSAGGDRSYVGGVHDHGRTAAYGSRSSRGTYAPGDGHSFELFVASILREAGWSAQVTKKGADSGVDVVASKSGRKVVVQAKNWKRPVGRRAVQEIFAGRAEYRADEAWLVSTNGFTAQAKESAQKLGVRLVTAAQLRSSARWR